MSDLTLKKKLFIKISYLKKRLVSFFSEMGLWNCDERILLITIKESEIFLYLFEKESCRNTEIAEIIERRAFLPTELQENKWRKKSAETAAFIKGIFKGEISCESTNDAKKGKSWQLPDKIVFLLEKEQYFVKKLELPHMPEKELCYAALWEADSYVPYGRGEYYSVAECPEICVEAAGSADGGFGDGAGVSGAAGVPNGTSAEDFYGAGVSGGLSDGGFGDASDGLPEDLADDSNLFDEVLLYAAEKDLVDALGAVGRELPFPLVGVVPGKEGAMPQLKSPLKNNLLPEKRQDKKNLRSYIYGAAAVLCVFLTVMMLFAGRVFSMQDKAAVADFRQKAEKQKLWKKRYYETKELERKLDFCKEKDKNLRRSGIKYGDFLDALAVSTPYSCSLDSVSIRNGEKAYITGEALDMAAVTEFSDNLRRKIRGAASRIAFARKSDKRVGGRAEGSGVGAEELVKFGMYLKLPLAQSDGRSGENHE